MLIVLVAPFKNRPLFPSVRAFPKTLDGLAIPHPRACRSAGRAAAATCDDPLAECGRGAWPACGTTASARSDSSRVQSSRTSDGHRGRGGLQRSHTLRSYKRSARSICRPEYVLEGRAFAWSSRSPDLRRANNLPYVKTARDSLVAYGLASADWDRGRRRPAFSPAGSQKICGPAQRESRRTVASAPS